MCDVARCTETGQQYVSCDGDEHDCEPDVWSGEWPGVDDVRRLGLRSLNDLGGSGTWWDSVRGRWEKTPE